MKFANNDKYRLVDLRSELPRHPTKKWKKRTKIDTIIIHTLASDNQDPYKTNSYHITPSKNNHISKTGAPRICYHDFIDKEGIIYRCNDYSDWTWHCGLWNKRSIGVSLAFKGQDNIFPNQEMCDSLLVHLVQLCCTLNILPNRIFGHREVPGMWTLLGNGSKRYKKVCPGLAINLDQLRKEATIQLQEKLKKEGYYPWKADGDFNCEDDRNALNSYNRFLINRNNLRNNNLL